MPRPKNWWRQVVRLWEMSMDSPKFLFYKEGGRHDVYTTKFVSTYGMHYVVIDREGRWLDKSKHPWVYATVDEAVVDSDHSGDTWVWLHPDATDYLDEYEHPEENVIYCVGSDYDGFDGKNISELSGVKLKIRQPPNQEGEWFAGMIVALVCYDRFLYLEGRRN